MQDNYHDDELLQRTAETESNDNPPVYHVPPVPAESISTKRKKRKGRVRMVALLLTASVFGGALGAGGVFALQALTGNINPEVSQVQDSVEDNVTGILLGNRENTVLDAVEVDTDKLMSAAEVYAANVNSTVGITTSITTNFWGYQSTSAASGSGFIISEDGYILTNFHVIDSSDQITVTLYSGDTHEAKLIGYDQGNDIAVLKVEADNLSPVIIGDSDNINVGDDVLAIGNPLGELTFSLTAGKISAKDREVTFSNSVTMQLMQTDCAINSGNSGGALFNMYGEVIGVTNAKYSSGTSGSASIDNIGFAIPMNTIYPIVQSIIEKGYVSKPYIGVSVMDLSKEYLMYGLPQGAAVQTVAQNSPAEEAGLHIGDIITQVSGNDIASSKEFARAIQSTQVGQEIKLTVYRKGNLIELTVTVSQQQQMSQTNPANAR